jgi:hypothetical protein
MCVSRHCGDVGWANPDELSGQWQSHIDDCHGPQMRATQLGQPQVQKNLAATFSAPIQSVVTWVARICWP